MDPISVGAVLAAIAGGAGGAVGSQLWAGVSALVRRPFRHAQQAADNATAQSGVVELAALEQAPGDQSAGLALAEVLMARAAADTEFGEELQGWWARASQFSVSSGDVTNTISGGSFSGPVIQARDIAGLTFGAPAPPASDPGTG